MANRKEEIIQCVTEAVNALDAFVYCIDPDDPSSMIVSADLIGIQTRKLQAAAAALESYAIAEDELKSAVRRMRNEQ
jgi:hypothetical protein